MLTAFAHSAKFPLVLWVLLFGIGMGIATASIPNLVIHSVPADVQASMSSMVQTSQTLIASIFPVAAFTVLNSHVATVIEGYASYTDTGMVVVYLMCDGAGGGRARLTELVDPAAGCVLGCTRQRSCPRGTRTHFRPVVLFTVRRRAVRVTTIID